MGKYLDFYCKDYNKELRKVVDSYLRKSFGWFPQKDYDDIYCIATDLIRKAEENYDDSLGSFENFVIPQIKNKIKQYITHENRQKRRAYQRGCDGKLIMGEDGKPIPLVDVSIYSPIGEEGDMTVCDTLSSDFDVWEEVSGDDTEEKVSNYLEKLSKVQRQIVEMRMNDIPINEIKERLNLTNSQYERQWERLKSFANMSELYKDESKEIKEEEKAMNTQVSTKENCKTDKISVAAVIKKIDKGTIRFNHPLQRESEQWTSAMKGNQVSDMLQGNRLHPLIFAEQIINQVAIIWGLDGKQRCTNAYSFAKNGFKISKKIRRPIIQYQTTEKDENGKEILDGNGFPIAKNEEFDIRGKRFSDLPEELQDRFMEYTFNYDQYLNCSSEDIGYHIERYNDGKPMTIAQKGITKLGAEFAEMTKAISSMSFFKDLGGYKISEFKNGTIDRVVTESVMATKYINDWKSDQGDMCKFLKENASIIDFEDFEDNVSRLENVITPDVADMFDSKDSFLWFALFDKFTNSGLSDERFIEFMNEFNTSDMKDRKVGDTTFNELSINKETGKTRSTKDKYIVVPKMEVLEVLMNEYLGIETSENANKTVLEMVNECVEDNLVEEDMEFYEDLIKDYSIEVDNDSPLLEEANKPSLIAIVHHACDGENDSYLPTWFVSYFGKTNTYEKQQNKNYLLMKNDFDSFVRKQAIG